LDVTFATAEVGRTLLGSGAEGTARGTGPELFNPAGATEIFPFPLAIAVIKAPGNSAPFEVVVDMP